jgi:hypothetical protein
VFSLTIPLLFDACLKICITLHSSFILVSFNLQFGLGPGSIMSGHHREYRWNFVHVVDPKKCRFRWLTWQLQNHHCFQPGRCAFCESQWPRGLRHELSSPAQTLGSWVRIPLKAWMPVRIYSVFVLSCMQVEALRRDDPPSKEFYRLCKRSRNWKSSQGPTKGCRAMDGWMDGWAGGRTDGEECILYRISGLFIEWLNP